MKKIDKDESYLRIVNPILNKDEFKQLALIDHHNTNRLEHSKKVSYYSYKIAKVFKLDEEATARAGLLHDFYLETTKEQENFKDKFELYSFKHPEEALENSRKYFKISDREENIIITHMFPFTKKMPRYKESWIVSCVDKSIAIGEFYKKFNMQFAVYALFIFNLLKMPI